MKPRKGKKKIEPCCERCAHWGLFDRELGECRRYAPRPKWSGCAPDADDSPGKFSQAVVEFPLTYGGTWCGEFKASGRKGPRP